MSSDPEGLMELVQRKADKLDMDVNEALTQIIHAQQAMESLVQLDPDEREKLTELMQTVSEVQGFDSSDEHVTNETFEQRLEALFEARSKIVELEESDANVGVDTDERAS